MHLVSFLIMTEVPKIDLFSDGGAEPNPGKGGYGVILRHGEYEKEFSQGYKLTTNNRMELMGVIVGLQMLKTQAEVKVWTDSKYVVEAVEKGWAKKWKENNWFRTKNEKAINIDLWERLLELLGKHEVNFNWIKGHSGHKENERCDKLAELALNGNKLIEDNGYQPDLEIKVKVEREGDECRKCGSTVEKRFPRHKNKKNQPSVYYEYYLFCPGCHTTYHTELARREIDNPSLFD